MTIRAGQWLADLLKDMSVEYTIDDVTDPTGDSTPVSSYLGALLQTFGRLIVRRNTPTIQTAVHSVHVRDRNMLQWLRAMNIPTGKPITLQFLPRIAGCL